MPRPNNEPAAPAAQERFRTTQWSVVLEARNRWPHCGNALEELCRTYWRPVYAFLRRSGHAHENAEDLVQGFFAHLLEADFLRNVEPARGRFRSFVLRSLNNYVTNEWHRSKRLKRGGEQTLVSFDELAAENEMLPADNQTPEQAFERHWARTVLDRALRRLEAEFQARGQQEDFFLLKPRLTGQLPDYAELAARLDTNEAALRTAICRMRARYGELVRDEVARTIADPKDLEEEIRYLLGLLS